MREENRTQHVSVPARPAPLFAQHNREILKEAGLDEAAIAALYESGTTADEPQEA